MEGNTLTKWKESNDFLHHLTEYKVNECAPVLGASEHEIPLIIVAVIVLLFYLPFTIRSSLVLFCVSIFLHFFCFVFTLFSFLLHICVLHVRCEMAQVKGI